MHGCGWTEPPTSVPPPTIWRLFSVCDDPLLDVCTGSAPLALQAAGSSDVLPMRYQRPGGIVGQSCDASGKKDSARPLPTTGSISGASRLSTTLRNSRVLSVYA